MATKGPFPLPVPPRIDKGGPSAAPFERRESDHNRQRPFDEKMSALRAYRRARGLCDKCAERWNKGHRCAEQVQLHALQELWELCQLTPDEGDQSSDTSNSADQLLAISVAAVQGINSTRTIQFMGTI